MFSVVMILTVVVAAPAPKEAPKKDPPSLLGEWVPESAVIGGKLDPPPAGAMLTFTKDGKCLMKEGTEAPVETTFTIDPKKDPAEIDIGEPRAAMAAIAMKGIYKFDGESLLICLAIGGERPKTFASPAGSATMLITLKRAKKN